MISYFIYAISITFGSWLIGLILNIIISKTTYYSKLSNFNFITSKKANKAIGLKPFKWIVENTFFKFFNQKINLKDKTVELSEIRKEMTYAEIGHLIAFVFVTIVALYKSFTHSFLLGLTLMIVNIILNLYPSLLQQENKRRIDRLIKIQNRKRNKS